VNKRNFVCLASIILAVSLFVQPLMAATPVQAPSKCPGTGVYLVETDDGDGPVFTLNISEDGSITTFFSNSGIVGSPTAAATTPDQGVYSCRRNRFRFRTLSFNLANQDGRPATMNRIDGEFRYNRRTKTISGSYEVIEFPLDRNPEGNGGTFVIERTFTGVPINVR
jgi:hypothetical protein